MMLFILSKKNLELSRAEAVNLLDLHDYELVGNILTAQTRRKDYWRLAYTREAHELLFRCNIENLEACIKKHNWKIMDYAVRRKGAGPSERRLANMVYHSIDKPKVNLRKPKDLITFFFEGDEVLVGRLVWSNEEDFRSRKPHLRADHSPVSLDPQLARCLVNMSGARYHVLDPCCGTGGLLLEAGLMGLSAEGIDIDPVMIRRAKRGLDHHGVDHRLHNKDVFQWMRKTRHIATDLPYGKNTRDIDDSFYRDFLKWLEQVMVGRAVVVFPHWIDVRRMSRLKVKDSFQYYIHRSMSKKIVIY